MKFSWITKLICLTIFIIKSSSDYISVGDGIIIYRENSSLLKVHHKSVPFTNLKEKTEKLSPIPNENIIDEKSNSIKDKKKRRTWNFASNPIPEEKKPPTKGKKSKKELKQLQNERGEIISEFLEEIKEKIPTSASNEFRDLLVEYSRDVSLGDLKVSLAVYSTGLLNKLSQEKLIRLLKVNKALILKKFPIELLKDLEDKELEIIEKFDPKLLKGVPRENLQDFPIELYREIPEENKTVIVVKHFISFPIKRLQIAFTCNMNSCEINFFNRVNDDFHGPLLDLGYRFSFKGKVELKGLNKFFNFLKKHHAIGNMIYSKAEDGLHSTSDFDFFQSILEGMLGN
jgi:hypothetical protein